MPTITLPDHSQRQFDNAVTVMQVAEAIGAGLAKATLGGLVNEDLVDASYLLEHDSHLRIITARDPEGLEIIRHSCAHLMAQAVKELYPAAQVTIGPVIEDGFYYDYAYETGFSELNNDLAKIEQKMQELAKADFVVTRSIKSRDEATAFFRERGEEYKAKIIESIPTNEALSFYSQGDFIDLCRGPHVPSTKHLKVFKLMKLAGAYWRGDSNNEMLYRIYGTAWADKKSLEDYLYRLEEAEKRDHRKIAKKQDLFHFQEEAPGMVFWHPKGWTLYKIIEQYLSKTMQDHGYQMIHTPQVVDQRLWEMSGHWDKFGENMFTTSSENRDYAIKPMNCPCHIQVFNQGLKSYRDLPIRLAEFGSCHRNEPSGTLHGLMRLRNFTQDDAHIFCTEKQIQDEVSKFIDLLFAVYKDFGFEQVIIKLSTRPENRVGSDDVWDKSEQALEQALNHKQLDWEMQAGEGAFYGPKIEFSLKDSIGRVWQCGTIQVDFSMPAQLNACYITDNSSKQVPVMLHRAIVGSMERFIGILIEHYAGDLSVWLAPIQIVVLAISDQQHDYAQAVLTELKKQGFRAEVDLRNETIGLKIRDHARQRIPYQVILGKREKTDNTLSVRNRAGYDLGTMNVEQFIQHLKKGNPDVGNVDGLTDFYKKISED